MDIGAKDKLDDWGLNAIYSEGEGCSGLELQRGGRHEMENQMFDEQMFAGLFRNNRTQRGLRAGGPC